MGWGCHHNNQNLARLCITVLCASGHCMHADCFCFFNKATTQMFFGVKRCFGCKYLEHGSPTERQSGTVVCDKVIQSF